VPIVTNPNTGLPADAPEESRVYVCVPAPGHYGDRTRVLAVFQRLEQAQAFARRGATAVYEGFGIRKGDVFYRVDAQSRKNLA
jgi:hypothetical protein